MRVLYAHEFDPAGVHIGHREALRAAGVECYVASRQAYRHRSDFDTSLPGDPDVIVACPGVGDGTGDWAARTSAEHGGRPTWEILPQWVEDLLKSYPSAKRVALFHGSPNLWEHRSEYARYWRDHGFMLAATTLDYATEIDCAWLPPAVEEIERRATLRGEKDPLFIIQTPSVPALCQTEQYIQAGRAAGAIPAVLTLMPHWHCLYAKSRFHVGFDQLRGAFSVNTIESAALGLALVFGLRQIYAERLRQEGLWVPSTAVSMLNYEGLVAAFARLVRSPRVTAEAQQEAREWYTQFFEPAHVAARLTSFYAGLP